MEDQYPAYDKNETRANDLVSVEQKIDEWKEEMAKDQTHADPEPAG